VHERKPTANVLAHRADELVEPLGESRAVSGNAAGWNGTQLSRTTATIFRRSVLTCSSACADPSAPTPSTGTGSFGFFLNMDHTLPLAPPLLKPAAAILNSKWTFT
jgi:hypothetical protein